MRWRDANRAVAGRVTPVEVFFDVVFVFTLTQLTRILEADLSLAGVGRVLLLFGVFPEPLGLTVHGRNAGPVQRDVAVDIYAAVDSDT